MARDEGGGREEEQGRAVDLWASRWSDGSEGESCGRRKSQPQLLYVDLGNAHLPSENEAREREKAACPAVRALL